MVILFVLLVAGCSGNVEQVQRAAGYDPLAADGARYAIGGFVAAEGVEVLPEPGTEAVPGLVDDPAVQSDVLASVLYGQLLAARGGRDVWAWPALQDNIPADQITRIQNAIRRGEAPPAEALATVAGDLPEIHYLVVARLDRNEVQVSDTEPTGLRSGQRESAGDPHAVPNSLLNSVRIRRTVGVTLEVFDLRDGRSVWRGSVERQRTELLSAKSVAEREDMVVTSPVGAEELPEIRLKGTTLKAPPLEGVVAEACEALIGSLFTAEK